MDQIKELVDAVSERLSSVANSDVVAGTPMELGGVTIVPISRISLGIGAGGGEGEAGTPGKKHGKHGRHGRGEGTGGATAGAGKIRPVAVAVLSGDGIEILSIDEKRGKLDRLLDKIPDLIERVKEGVAS